MKVIILNGSPKAKGNTATALHEVEQTLQQQGIETEWIGGAALDTIEGEEGICHVDIKTKITDRQNLFYLKQFPNVIYTPHLGFYTAEAVAQMVESAFLGITLCEQGKENKFKV